MRCTVCRKQRPFKSSDPALCKMQCGVGPQIVGGPGAELRRLFREIGVTGKAGCNCKELAARMDAWGVNGCRARLSEIVAELKAKASKFGIGEWAAAGWSAAWQGKPLTLSGLVNLAIDRAEAAAGCSDQPSCSC